MAVRAPHLYRSLRCFCLGTFSLLHHELEHGGRAAVRVRGARLAGPARAVRVPAARALVRRRAGASGSPGCGTPAPRSTTCAPSRPPRSSRAPTPTAARPPDEALLRTVLVPLVTVGRRGVRRLRLERRGLRPRLPRARALALRDAARLRRRRAARRDLGRRRRSSSAAASGCAPPRPASSPAHWPEANGLLPAGFGREPDRLCVLELERVAARRRRRAARRARRAVRRRQRAAAGHGGRDLGRPRALRAARLAAVRHPPRAPDRRHAAARRGRAARPGARLARRRPARADRLAPRTIPSSPRRSTAGSCRCSRTSRSARSSSASRWPRCSAAPTACGPRPCAPRCCSARPPRDRGDLLARLRALTSGEEVEPAAADILRRALVQALGHGDRPRAGRHARRVDPRPAPAARAVRRPGPRARRLGQELEHELVERRWAARGSAGAPRRRSWPCGRRGSRWRARSAIACMSSTS